METGTRDVDHLERAMSVQPKPVLAFTAIFIFALTVLLPVQAKADRDHGPGTLRSVAPLNGPRGLDALGHGRTLVSEADGSFSLVVEHRRAATTVVPLGSVPADFSPAIARGRDGTVYILTGGAPPDAPSAAGSATLYAWHKGDLAPTAVADIAAYQATDPDPDDLEGLPGDSNPFGLAALKDGSVLVADAAGNDLLRVFEDGTIVTVARLAPRTVEVPAGLPGAGTMVPSEAVATSVTVGKDGDYYVGELRGYPATSGTSQVWRIEKGSVDATCDPDAPTVGECTRLADGLTSIVDLASDKRRNIYAVSLSTMSWLAVENAVAGSEVGALWRIGRARGHGHDRGDGRRTPTITELLAGQLILPGGADAVDDTLYLTGPVLGPGGALSKVALKHP